jgi:DNA-binding transcriptional ArsR family regulator
MDRPSVVRPPPPFLTDPRYLVAKALLDICRIAARHDPNGEAGPAPHVETLLLLWTIYIGQAEGRPFSASKIAYYTGMPRVTVMRKLAPLIVAGKVERKRRGYCLCEEWLADPHVGTLVYQVIAIFKSVGAKLTILDTQALDEGLIVGF